MIQEGSRVKLRPGSQLGRTHPELAGAVGVVGSVSQGPSWQSLNVRLVDRPRDVRMHVRFLDLNVVAMNVPAADVEQVDLQDLEEPRNLVL